MNPLRLAKDRPSLVTGTLGLVVAAHWALGEKFDRLPQLATTMAGVPYAWEIYIGAAAVVAIAAGFAGVVIVFAMAGGNAGFERLRYHGDAHLRANWLALVTAPSLAAALLLVATVSTALGHGHFAAWMFELAMLLAVHGYLRMMWLLRALMQIVGAEDARHVERAQRPVSLATVMGDQAANRGG